ncbi:undecaprenyl diphosphate synthase family protein [uncultured Brevundimonas sp.]|uniref:undecaprenyl diphosphate synthase family protein n=1 Tax=uncultured Brevundimonas sp. TaxID=213418 RepID=UPI0025EDB894|nr:undecaprenyl diphosphate synthase family protein [uncultured Brevundimonas sp.]
MQVAFNYGGRADLVDAARRHMERVLAGETVEPFNEAILTAGLATAGSPPLDLIVRTSTPAPYGDAPRPPDPRDRRS